MTKAPAIAIAETSSVRRSPARSSSPLSRTNDQFERTTVEARALHQGRKERPRVARPLLVQLAASCYGHTVVMSTLL